IRDFHVTGVQTCALPISMSSFPLRAQIIEGLIHDGYIERKGKELIVTAKGLSLITLLRNLHTDVLCTPEMTGEWESRLKQMAHRSEERRVGKERTYRWQA